MARKLGSALPGGGSELGRPLDLLARRIRALRAERRLTQEEFASRAGISVSFVSMLERGERSPSYETLLQLALGLDVPAGELFREAAADGAYDDPYFHVLGEFARGNRLTRGQVDRLLQVGQALFDLPGPLPARPHGPSREIRTCGAESCGRPVLAKGLCSAHYHARRRHRAEIR